MGAGELGSVWSPRSGKIFGADWKDSQKGYLVAGSGRRMMKLSQVVWSGISLRHGSCGHAPDVSGIDLLD